MSPAGLSICGALQGQAKWLSSDATSVDPNFLPNPTAARFRRAPA